MRVTAKCIMQAFDNKTSTVYYPNQIIENFDTESQLASLKTPMGKYVFTWPGRDSQQSVDEKAKPQKEKKTLTDEQRAALGARLAAGRAAKRAEQAVS